MGLHELILKDFRLFAELRFTPDPDAITVLLSPNGTGKTSVLEAVYAMATASSFRSSAAGDMIRTSCTMAEVHGVLFHHERRISVDLTLTKGARNTTKRMLVNGQRPRTRADVSEALPLTVFTPEGVDIIRQGPEHRRGYLTTLLTDVDLNSGDVIERFARVLSQRNALLRNLHGERPSPLQRDELEVWSLDLAVVGEQLVNTRRRVLEQLAPLVDQRYRELARNSDPVVVQYEQSWSGTLKAALDSSLDEDRYRGYTSVGPQRDDILVTLAGRDARRQASQGEQRSLALALRLAGHQLVQHTRGVDPLLLLDDVFSELDPLRSDRLLQMLPVGQTLVTTASPLPTKMTPAAVVDLTKDLQ
ncbi:MAG TPA: DNA replication and repair protein RecF [Acidimicrobiales bacterium]|nr:DNA replication and repair protein RecF [Acidimicrobiales bacterium]